MDSWAILYLFLNEGEYNPWEEYVECIKERKSNTIYCLDNVKSNYEKGTFGLIGA